MTFSNMKASSAMFALAYEYAVANPGVFVENTAEFSVATPFDVVTKYEFTKADSVPSVDEVVVYDAKDESEMVEVCVISMRYVML
mmetsp:Transcript_2828/g.3191  ORF Transcript_2828/g.3191 Transcript_2828/m.3191 type:complete len:85 (+) Transcript_2828:25-279(+)